MHRTGALVRKKYIEYLSSTMAFSASIYIAAIVDGILIGRLIGPEAFTAINLTYPVLYIKNILFCLFISGGCTLAAQFMGNRDLDKAGKAFSLAMKGGLIASLILTVVGILSSGFIAALLSGDSIYRADVLRYLVPLWASGPLVIITNGSAAFMRLEGRHKLAIKIPVFANIVNLSCDYIFIRFFGWGIAGAGWATCTGYLAAGLLIIPYYTDKKKLLRFQRLNGKDLGLLKTCLKTGLPISMIDACDMLRNYTINTTALTLIGDTGGQVISVCNAALLYAAMLADGASTSMTSVVGALYGEQDKKGILHVLKNALIITGILCLTVFCLIELFPVQFAGIYGIKDAAVLSLLVPYLRIYCTAMLFMAPLYCIRAFYQSTKHENAATFLSLFEGALIMIPVFFILSRVGILPMAASYTVSIALSLLSVCLYMGHRAKREGCDNFLMIKAGKQLEGLDVSIPCTIEGAMGVSEKLISFGKEKGLPDRIYTAAGVSAEELCTNISKWAGLKESDSIDVFFIIHETHVILKTRDSGRLFNPTEFIEDDKLISGLKLVRALSAKIEYDSILGFNTTTVTFTLNYSRPK